MKSINNLIKDHPFFENLPTNDLDFIAGCGKNIVFKEGDYIAKEDDQADFFFLIRKGKVSIETFIPNKKSQVIETLQEGEIIGWSWLFPPYKWTFDVRAMTDVHSIALDGNCLREKCDEDPRLGQILMKRFARIMTQRLRATRMQMLDIYGEA